ncbi:MAG: BREX-2 system phosphatase PglZ [Acidimicrobiales bacterium]
MTVPKATGAQLAALVERVLARQGDSAAAPLVLVHADPAELPPLDAVGGRAVVVRGSRSPLEVRALARAPRTKPLVVLTNAARAALGDDLLARAAGRRVQELDRWANVCQLFGARRPTAELVRRPHLADALVEARPLAGYPQVATRVLDLDTATAALVRAYLDVSDDVTTLAQFLEWAARPASVGRVADTGNGLLDDLRATLRDRFGAGVDAVIAAMASGWSADVVPLGLAAGVVHHPDADDAARARLDERLYRPGLDAAAYRHWSAAAGEAATGADDPGRGAGWLARAEGLLSELGAIGRAHLSDLLPAGFDQRVRLAAEALETWRARRDDAGLAAAAHAAIKRAAAHRHAHRAPERIERVRMAARLVRRGSLSWPAADDLASVAAAYARDGAWLDLARTAISRGDTDPVLATLCADLTAAADAARLADGPGFARVATRAADPLPAGVTGVEWVLDEIVAPLARGRPVLVAVLDGMGWPTFVELVSSLEGAGWAQWRRPGDAGEPVAVAALPTVTEVSRTSLLAGTLRRGDDASERRAFSSHPALVGASHADQPPVLFHKSHLRVGGLDTTPGDLLDHVADTRQRVVGVVINNIDERLKDVVQPPAGWTLAELDPLRAALDAARRAGRAVVLTADHGHILDRDAEPRPPGGGGERWRLADPPAGDGEIEVRGPRVVPGVDAIVMPWREQLHYGTRRNGYHGGLTPQELFVPVVTLSADDLEGWTPTAVRRPPWWYQTAVLGEPGLAPSPAARPSRPAEAPATPTLFDVDEPTPAPAGDAGTVGEPAPTAPPWVPRLLASELFGAQRRNPRVRLGDDELERLLLAFDRMRNVPWPEPRLADEARLPAARIGRYIAQVQDLLNVDGYPVVTAADGAVRFDRALLERQFGL